MTIYIITIVLLFAFAIIDATSNISKREKLIMSAISYLLIVFQVGLRWETGTDWDPYLNQFESLSNTIPGYYSNAAVEYGYFLSIWIVKFLFNDYSIYLLLHAIFFYLLIFNSFRHYTPYLFLSLLLFYSMSVGMWGSNRQLIALAICIYSLRYIVEKKNIPFAICMLIAISFHSSAYIFVVYYFLNREINRGALIILLAVSFIIYLLGFSQSVVSAFSYISNWIGGVAASKTDLYIESAKSTIAEHELPIVGLFRRMIFLSIFYYNRKKLSERLPYYNIMLNGYIVGVVFYFLFANTLLVLISRGSLYFNIMAALLLSSQVYIVRTKENKAFSITFLLALACLLFYQSISPYPDLFLPYKGVFINSDYFRIMH